MNMAKAELKLLASRLREGDVRLIDGHVFVRIDGGYNPDDDLEDIRGDWEWICRSVGVVSEGDPNA